MEFGRSSHLEHAVSTSGERRIWNPVNVLQLAIKCYEDRNILPASKSIVQDFLMCDVLVNFLDVHSNQADNFMETTETPNILGKNIPLKRKLTEGEDCHVRKRMEQILDENQRGVQHLRTTMEVEQDQIKKEEIEIDDSLRQKAVQDCVLSDSVLNDIKTEPLEASWKVGEDSRFVTRENFENGGQIKSPFLVQVKVDPNINTILDEAISKEDFKLYYNTEDDLEDANTFLHGEDEAVVGSENLNNAHEEFSCSEGPEWKTNGLMSNGAHIPKTYFKERDKTVNNLAALPSSTAKNTEIEAIDESRLEKREVVHMYISNVTNNMQEIELKTKELETTGKREPQKLISLHEYERKTKRHAGIHCKVCGKKFFSQLDFKIHKNIHNTIEHFSCTVCGRSFDRITNLLVHKWRHSD